MTQGRDRQYSHITIPMQFPALLSGVSCCPYDASEQKEDVPLYISDYIQTYYHSLAWVPHAYDDPADYGDDGTDVDKARVTWRTYVE